MWIWSNKIWRYLVGVRKRNGGDKKFVTAQVQGQSQVPLSLSCTLGQLDLSNFRATAQCLGLEHKPCPVSEPCVDGDVTSMHRGGWTSSALSYFRISAFLSRLERSRTCVSIFHLRPLGYHLGWCILNSFTEKSVVSALRVRVQWHFGIVSLDLSQTPDLQWSYTG